MQYPRANKRSDWYNFGMQVSLPSGRYIAAISGGVDSVTLLNLLSVIPTAEIVVAHFDHGIRPDSADDAAFVRKLAENYGFPFETACGNLGPQASESLARKRRYDFLKKAMVTHNATAIITAHHQDDLIETAAINLLRGTSYRGLYALRSRDHILRPMLSYTKQDIIDYAQEKGLEWREDHTNTDPRYLRNRLRACFRQQLTEPERANILACIRSAQDLGEQISAETEKLLPILCKGGVIRRQLFIKLPHSIACEVLAALLRKKKIVFDRPLIERAVIECKVLPVGKRCDMSGGWCLQIESVDDISFKQISSV